MLEELLSPPSAFASCALHSHTFTPSSAASTPPARSCWWFSRALHSLPCWALTSQLKKLLPTRLVERWETNITSSESKGKRATISPSPQQGESAADLVDRAHSTLLPSSHRGGQVPRAAPTRTPKQFPALPTLSGICYCVPPRQVTATTGYSRPHCGRTLVKEQRPLKETTHCVVRELFGWY